MKSDPPALGMDRPQVETLTGLRIVAALWVVLEHFKNPLFTLLPATRHAAWFFRDGYLGVEIFFILSGFVISYQYAERLAPFTVDAYGRYLRLRFARIYPVHLVALLTVGVLVLASRFAHINLAYAGNYTPLTGFSNLTMWQAIPPGVPWNGPSWSITMEGLAYVAFPLLAAFVVRVTRRSIAVPCGAACIAWTVTGIMLLGRSAGYSSIGVPEALLRISGEFMAGCFLWAAWRISKRSHAWDFVGCAALAGAAATLVATRPAVAANFWALPFLALFVYACAAASGPLAALLSTRAFQWGGRVSYSIYMTHFIVLMVVGKVLRWTDYTDHSIAVRAGILGCYALAVVAAASAMYYIVEEPARKWLRPKPTATKTTDESASSPDYSAPATGG